MDLMASGLLSLAQYAKDSNVSVLIESHGDLVHSEDLEKVLKAAEHQHAGMVWDVANMWNVTKQPPKEVYALLKNYIHHTHIKDNTGSGEKVNYCLLGKGIVPIFEAIDLLYKGGYKGYYSFEWEKLWHPEIAASEVAIGDYPKAMKEHFSKK